MIVHMIHTKNRATISQMPKVAQCSERSITNVRKNLRLSGSARSLPVSVRSYHAWRTLWPLRRKAWPLHRRDGCLPKGWVQYSTIII